MEQNTKGAHWNHSSAMADQSDDDGAARATPTGPRATTDEPKLEGSRAESEKIFGARTHRRAGTTSHTHPRQTKPEKAKARGAKANRSVSLPKKKEPKVKFEDDAYDSAPEMPRSQSRDSSQAPADRKLPTAPRFQKPKEWAGNSNPSAAQVNKRLTELAGSDWGALTDDELMSGINDLRGYGWKLNGTAFDNADTKTRYTETLQGLLKVFRKRMQAAAGGRRPPRVLQGVKRGRTPVEGGTPAGIARYGYNTRDATAEQLAARYANGYVGHGAYFGSKLGGAYGRVVAPWLAKAKLVKSPGNWDEWATEKDYIDAATNLGSRLEDRALDFFLSPLDRYRGKRHRAEGYSGQGAYYDGIDDPEAEVLRAVPVSVDEEMFPLNTALPTPVNGAVTKQMLGGGNIVFFNTGDRHLQTNQLVDPGSIFSRNPIGIFTTPDEKGNLVVRHNEYIGDLTSTSVNFTTVSLSVVNPGLVSFAPLLARFGVMYEKYRPRKVIVKYRTLITSGNSTGAGAVMIAAIYNPEAAPYNNKRDMENSGTCASGKVDDTIIMGVECQKDQGALGGGWYYIRTDPLATGQDPIGFDFAQIQVAMQGVPVGLPAGELWIEYEFELASIKTQLLPTLKVNAGISYTQNFNGVSGSTMLGANRQQLTYNFFNTRLVQTGPPPYTDGCIFNANGQMTQTLFTTTAGPTLNCAASQFAVSPDLQVVFTPGTTGTGLNQGAIFQFTFSAVAGAIYGFRWICEWASNSANGAAPTGGSTADLPVSFTSVGPAVWSAATLPGPTVVSVADAGSVIAAAATTTNYFATTDLSARLNTTGMQAGVVTVTIQFPGSGYLSSSAFFGNGTSAGWAATCSTVAFTRLA